MTCRLKPGISKLDCSVSREEVNKDMNWLAPATGRRGRQPTFSDAAISLCLTIKCLFGLALRQATGMVKSMLRLAGIDCLHRNPDPLCYLGKFNLFSQLFGQGCMMHAFVL